MSTGMSQLSLLGSSAHFNGRSPVSELRRKARLLDKKIEKAEHGYNPRELEFLRQEKRKLSQKLEKA